MLRTPIKDQEQENKEIRDSEYESGQENLEVSPYTQLGRHLYSKYQTWKDARQAKENQWMNDLHAANSRYTSQELSVIQAKGPFACTTYVGVTRYKVTSAIAKLYSLIFPGPNKKNWSISPTPVPEIVNLEDKNIMKYIPPEALEELQKIMDSGKPIPEDAMEEMQKMVKTAIQNEAEKANTGMEKKIEDLLMEAKYAKLFKNALHELVTFGTGAVKTATLDIKIVEKWGKKEETAIDPKTGEETVTESWGLQRTEKSDPGIRFVSIFYLYPDPDAETIESATGVFERHRMTRKELRDMKDYREFDSEVIERVIKNNQNGNYTKEWYETFIDNITDRYTSAHGDNMDRYEVLEYWGYVDGDMLYQSGMDIPEDMRGIEYQANIWTVDQEIICTKFNKLEPSYIPYALFPYEKVTGTIWGDGVPKKMEQSAKLMNSMFRSLMDNVGQSALPQVEINVDLIHESQLLSVLKMKGLEPGKIWFRSGMDNSEPMIRFSYPRSNVGQFLRVIEMLRRIIDEESNIPAITQGESVWKGSDMTSTASGMSMMLQEATNVSKGVIVNIDDYFITVLITSLYNWLMKWSEDDDIKGDMNVRALGTASYVAKEARARNIMSFYNLTNNPKDATLTKRTEILREIAIALDIDPERVVLTDDEIKALTENPMQKEMQDMELSTAKGELEKLMAEVEKLMAEAGKIQGETATGVREGGGPEEEAEVVSGPGSELSRMEIEDKAAHTAIKMNEAQLVQEKITTERSNRTNAEMERKVKMLAEFQNKRNAEKRSTVSPVPASEEKEKKGKEKSQNINVGVSIDGKAARVAVYDDDGKIVGARDAKEGELEQKESNK
jgi:hypothetical protein